MKTTLSFSNSVDLTILEIQKALGLAASQVHSNSISS